MIGDRIKELRKKNRYTQKEIGEMCGVSDISVYKWETDRTEPNHPRAHGVWIVGAVHGAFPLSSCSFSHKKSPLTAQVKAAKGSKKARRMAGGSCFTLPPRRWLRG